MKNDAPCHENQGTMMEKYEKTERFERLLSQMSAKYINLPVEKIESTVKKDFGDIAGLLGGDSCNFHVFDHEKRGWTTLFDTYEILFMWARHKQYREDLKKFRSHPEFTEKMRYMFERWGQFRFLQ